MKKEDKFFFFLKRIYKLVSKKKKKWWITWLDFYAEPVGLPYFLVGKHISLFPTKYVNLFKKKKRYFTSSCKWKNEK